MRAADIAVIAAYLLALIVIGVSVRGKQKTAAPVPGLINSRLSIPGIFIPLSHVNRVFVRIRRIPFF